MTPEQIKAREELIPMLVKAQYMAGEVGMFKTMHLIDEAKDAAGWELAESLSAHEGGSDG